MAGGHQRHFLRADEAPAGLDARDAPGHPPDAGHLAMLKDIDASGIGAACIAPGDGIVPGDAAAPLQGRAEDRVAHGRRDRDRRTERLDAFRVEPFRIDAVQAVGVHPADRLADIVLGVRQVQYAALAQHDVEIELAGQALPELQPVFVDRSALVPQVVGADDGRVARDIAAGEPALFHHGDIGDAVFLCQVVGRRQPVAAAADDHDLIGRPRFRRAPELRPVPVAGKRIARQRKDRVTRHRMTSPGANGPHITQAALDFQPIVRPGLAQLRQAGRVRRHAEDAQLALGLFGR